MEYGKLAFKLCHVLLNDKVPEISETLPHLLGIIQCFSKCLKHVASLETLVNEISKLENTFHRSKARRPKQYGYLQYYKGYLLQLMSNKQKESISEFKKSSKANKKDVYEALERLRVLRRMHMSRDPDALDINNLRIALTGYLNPNKALFDLYMKRRQFQEAEDVLERYLDFVEGTVLQ